jgi:tRNA-2-methylthio-N6-dimethylallyladenosine synthase
MKPRYFIQTFGCQMNVHDSERMAGMLDDLGYEPTPEAEAADVILMNTCAVRERPEHKLYSELGVLRHLKDAKPNLVIGVAGCMAQREADNIRRRVPEVDILLGPRNLHHLPHLLRETQRDRTGEIGARTHSDGLDLECDPTPVTSVRRRSSISAYVDVIFGCNFNCTYCAVPSARGREVSRRPSEVLDEIRQLVDLGYRELTLLGQTVNAYGHDLGRLDDGTRIDFAWLLGQINRIDSKLRVRYTSPHPMYFNDRLIDAIAENDCVCEHLHMPLQSGDNDCLRRMKRTYTIEKYAGIIAKVRERMPNCAVTTDLIVGFCGETEAEFQNTLKAVRDIGFDQAFMFAYSPRHSTVAWEWPDDVPHPTKIRRLQELVAVINDVARAKNHAQIGETFEVLVEGISDKDPSRLMGRSRTNKLVMFDGDLQTLPPGSLVEVQMREGFLWGYVGDLVRTVRAPAPSRTIMELPVLA